MKYYCLLLTAALCLTIVSPACTETPPVPPAAQSLYLQAGKFERQGETAKARETYEQIIDRFPESEFAVKANDRLLSLPTATGKATAHPVTPLPELFKSAPAPVPANPPVAAPATAPAPPPAKPPSGIEAFLAPATPKPLPADPLKRRGVELARMLQQAQDIRLNEISKKQRSFDTQYGHRYSRSKLTEEKTQWELEAEQEVLRTLGRSQAAIEQDLATLCGQLGLPPKCGEEEITR